MKGLLMVTVAVPDHRAAAAQWCAATGHEVIAEHAVASALAGVWGVEHTNHPAAIVVGPPGATGGLLRLVECDPGTPTAPPSGRIRGGPIGPELLSRDVDEACRQLQSAPGFTVTGPPHDFSMSEAGAGTARAMRVTAPGGFECLVNTVKSVPAPRSLPTTEHLVAHAWNMPITAADLDAVKRFYGEVLGMELAMEGVLAQEAIDQANGFPPGSSFTVAVYRTGPGMQYVESQVHDPELVAFEDPVQGRLRRGVAMVTLAIEDLGPVLERAKRARLRTGQPAAITAPPYDGRRAVAVDGPSGEKVELVEVG